MRPSGAVCRPSEQLSACQVAAQRPISREGQARYRVCQCEPAAVWDGQSCRRRRREQQTFPAGYREYWMLFVTRRYSVRSVAGCRAWQHDHG